MKIAFVGNYQYNCGSSNTLLGYYKAGLEMGHDIRVSEFGYVDDIIRTTVPVSSKSWKPDLLVIVFESYPFLSEKDIQTISKNTPRKRRVIIDPDGKYLKPVKSGGDTNHSDTTSYNYWTNLYNSLSDSILIPTLAEIKYKNVYPFLYFGIDKIDLDLKSIKKEFDVLYVGNNWYRWKDILTLINGIKPIRKNLGRIGLVGRYWDSETMNNFREATISDPTFMKENNVEILSSADYGEVETTMSRGNINPIFVRPILNKLKLITPRMFETFAADTLPIIPKYFTHAPKLYGKEVEDLVISDNLQLDVGRIFENHDKYYDISRNIHKKLIVNHSYRVRIQDLLKFI